LEAVESLSFVCSAVLLEGGTATILNVTGATEHVEVSASATSLDNRAVVSEDTLVTGWSLSLFSFTVGVQSLHAGLHATRGRSWGPSSAVLGVRSGVATGVLEHVSVLSYT